MARPQKKGLQYFPLDVDAFESDEFKLIKAEFGSEGLLIVMQLFCKIYKTNGYYYEWGGDQCLLLAAGAGVVPTFVMEVLKGCLRRSIFDDRVFKMFGTLTSHGIQTRYFKAIDSRKLSAIDIKEELLLLSASETTEFFGKSRENISMINSDKNVKIDNNLVYHDKPPINHDKPPINHDLRGVNPCFSTQRKEKKSNTTTHTITREEENDFLKKSEEREIVSKKNNSDEMKQKLLDYAWLEQACVGQNFKMDDFKPFVENYINLKILTGDFDNYKITQHKHFVISDFNKKKSDEIKKTQNVRATPQQRESVLEHNKRIFEELQNGQNMTKWKQG